MDGRSLRVARAFVTDTGVALGVPLRGPGMPRFSARLLAMEDCGSRRRDGARVGEEVEGEEVLSAEPFGGGEAVADSGAWLASLFFSLVRGASLMRPASLWWWSSRRLRIRRACYTCQMHSAQVYGRAYLSIMGILGGLVEGRGSELVLLARGRDAVAIRGCGGITDVLVGFGELCGLHIAVLCAAQSCRERWL